jgi:acyl-CoA thioesterase-1
MREFLLSLILFIVPSFGVSATILVLGDSISAGYGLENPERGWVALLGEKLRASGRNIEVVNASISGDTSAGGRARIDSLLSRHKPSVLILELGANDGLRGLAPNRMHANLAEIIRRAKEAGAGILLLGMRMPPNYGKRYADMFAAVYPTLAKQSGATLVPFLMQGVGGKDHLMQADGLHPNDEAQPILLQQVWEKLEPML